MELTSVFPSATSPTEGDDLCEIDGNNVAIHSVTFLISLCGLVGNGAVHWLLRNDYHYPGILEWDFPDFPFLLFAVPSALLFLVEDVSCSPILPLLYLRFLFQLSVFSCYWVLFQLFRIHTVDYMWKLCTLCCRRELPLRLRWVLYRVQSWAAFALFTVIPTVTYQCPSHHQEQCRAVLISMYALILLLFLVHIVIFDTINLIKTMRESNEQEYKWIKITTFLVVLLTFLLSLFHLLQQLGYIIVSYQIYFLLTCIYSSIKPFIHFLAGRCRRPCCVRSRRLSQQRVFNGLEENPFSMDSLRFSLQRILDGLQENRISMDSQRLSLKRIYDGLK